MHEYGPVHRMEPGSWLPWWRDSVRDGFAVTLNHKAAFPMLWWSEAGWLLRALELYRAEGAAAVFPQCELHLMNLVPSPSACRNPVALLPLRKGTQPKGGPPLLSEHPETSTCWACLSPTQWVEMAAYRLRQRDLEFRTGQPLCF